MLSREDYQDFVDRLSSRELKIRLSRSPTTMGPGYIADKIAEILDVKSDVNEMAEKVELALCDAEVRLNNLEEEIQLRTHMEYQDPHSPLHDVKNAAAREAFIWGEVEKKYVEDRTAALVPGEPIPVWNQLSEDVRSAKNEIVELKALLRILNHRRDELVKLDSGVRLQQKTMETEASIYGKGGMPQVSAPTNGDYSIPADRANGEPTELDDPGAMDEEEDFATDPPPITR